MSVGIPVKNTLDSLSGDAYSVELCGGTLVIYTSALHSCFVVMFMLLVISNHLQLLHKIIKEVLGGVSLH